MLLWIYVVVGFVVWMQVASICLAAPGDFDDLREPFIAVLVGLLAGMVWPVAAISVVVYLLAIRPVRRRAVPK